MMSDPSQLLRPLPWHEANLRDLLLNRERMPHAMLVTAPLGTGALEFARALAAGLLCETATGERKPGACGICPACHWMLAGNHPDLRWIGLDDESVSGEGDAEAEPDQNPRDAPTVAGPSRGKSVRRRPEIRIEAIRNLANFTNTGARRSGLRVIVISAADRMNLAAANALLKTLEEPLPGVVFILASEAPERVLPTVRSRCVRAALVAPDEAMARHWIIANTGIDPMIAQRLLDAGGGAPILALGFADPERFEAYQAAQAAIASLPAADLLEVAQRLEALDPTVWVPALQRWVEDLARVAHGAQPRSQGLDIRPLSSLAALTTPQALATCAQDLLTFRRSVDHPLNPRLYAEATLRVYARAFESRKINRF